MSYSLHLTNPATNETIELPEPHALAGGTYAIGGTTEAWLNVTYNYARHFHRVLGPDGIRSIYGLTGEESIPILERAAGELADDVSPDYWAATEGNARRALLDLVALARLAPHGVWEGD